MRLTNNVGRQAGENGDTDQSAINIQQVREWTSNAISVPLKAVTYDAGDTSY